MRHVQPRPLLLVVLSAVLAVLLLNAISQALPRLFVAQNVLVAPLGSTTVPANDPAAIAFIATHPETRFGFWKQCNDGVCHDLELPCGNTTPQPSAHQLADPTAGPSAQAFVDTVGILCPRYNAARVLMSLSLFAGVVASLAILLRIFGRRGVSRIPLLFAAVATSLMATMLVVALALVTTVKHAFEDLATIFRSLTSTGTSTSLADVTTLYHVSSSFYILIAATALSFALLPLVFILTLHPSSHDSGGPTKSTSTTTLPMPIASRFPSPSRMPSSGSTSRYYSGSTTASAPQTVLAPPYTDMSSSSSGDEDEGMARDSRSWIRR
ncbi:hypothetical protein HKX48_006836 [Thoreauomyces humboldtii]|nr:hypothetical protein HKX48_006836 [Thoreauomyces humboldtii]